MSARVLLEPPNPSGLCMCGCGEKTPLAKQGHTKLGYVKGYPVRFMRSHSSRTTKGGPTHGKPSTYTSGCRCGECKEAYSAWRRERYYANHEAEKARLRASYARNREQRLLAKKCATYAITPAAFDALLDEQGGTCAACGRISNRTLCVDHDHQCGMVRGLLCNNCNFALGLLGESQKRIQSLADYLCKWEVCCVS